MARGINPPHLIPALPHGCRPLVRSLLLLPGPDAFERHALTQEHPPSDEAGAPQADIIIARAERGGREGGYAAANTAGVGVGGNLELKKIQKGLA